MVLSDFCTQVVFSLYSVVASNRHSVLNRKPRKSIVSFVNLLEDASKKLYDQHISPFEFLNKLTAANVDNQLIDENWGTWGLEHSRVDLQPESEEYDEEDIDSPASETVDSDAA